MTASRVSAMRIPRYLPQLRSAISALMTLPLLYADSEQQFIFHPSSMSSYSNDEVLAKCHDLVYQVAYAMYDTPYIILLKLLVQLGV